MPCIQRSPEKGCKAQTIDAPYCRSADWWRSSDYQLENEPFLSRCTQRKRRARTLKAGKQWSVVILSSGTEKKTPSPKLVEEFYRLAQQWENETSFHSSLGEIFTHEAYQRIMAMGRDALPLILSELRRRPGHWFYALEKIVGQDMAVGSRTFAAARGAWLEWGYKNNYI